VDDVFTDHLRYVNKQIQEYITSTYGDGGNIWKTLSPTMYVILTTPNGWEGSQQNRMRQAAIRGGLVDKDGGQRVKFVTEAEVPPIILILFTFAYRQSRLLFSMQLIPAVSETGL
jgi:hypothetical protein